MWQAYKDQGVVVWGIASRENQNSVQDFVEKTGMTFPVLMDSDGKVNQAYAMQMAFPTAAYPQDWVIGTDGIVVYANNELDLEALTAAVERELD